MGEFNGEKLEPYSPPFAVWELIQSTVPPKELPLVRSYLGESSIEYCLDLRNELETLLDIWKEVGDQIQPPTVSKSIDKNKLPDPPQMRDMLTREIQLLVMGIQEKNGFADAEGLEASDKKVIQYAMISQKSNNDLERPGTPLRRLDPENIYTTSPVKLKHIRRNINATDIDAVAEILKDAIQKECRALEHDIEFLQRCVEEEHEVACSRPASPIEEPSLLKLRQVCKTLEAQVLSEHSVKQGYPETSSTTMSVQNPRSPAVRGDRIYSSDSSNSPHSTSKRGSITSIGQLKMPTPPSPNRIHLKSLGSLHKTSTPEDWSLKSVPNSSHHSMAGTDTTTALTSSLELRKHNSKAANECWIEPSWTQCMSDSPPTTADSGVCSRPATCDLVSIQDRMLMLSSRAGFVEPMLDASPRYAPKSQNDNGYHTSSSTEITNDLETFSGHRDVAETAQVKQKPASQHKTTQKPHPPSSDTGIRARRTISNIRFSRKPVQSN